MTLGCSFSSSGSSSCIIAILFIRPLVAFEIEAKLAPHANQHLSYSSANEIFFTYASSSNSDISDTKGEAQQLTQTSVLIVSCMYVIVKYDRSSR